MNVLVGMIATLMLMPTLQDTTNLEWKPKVGDTMDFLVNMQMNVNLGGMEGELGSSYRQSNTIKEIQGEKVTTETVLSQFESTFNGQPAQVQSQNPMDGRVINTIHSLDGKYISSEGQEPVGGARVRRVMSFHRPGKEVRVGDKWEHEWPAVEGTETVAAKSSWTLKESTSLDGVECWLVESAFAEKEGSVKMKAKGLYWVKKSDGHLEKLKVEFTDATLLKDRPPTSGMISVTRAQKSKKSATESREVSL
jgi:hypothetical protein